ncbi:MAG: MarR family transcriptional regulator [Chloroflexi bacterium]|nr:MarR family transcriptional regulator [Chloroflexota bacterium]
MAAIRALFSASALLDPMRLRIWDAEGLTVTQLRLLSFLSEEDGLSNAALADRLLVTRPSVSALLERLERGGFIRREVAPNDRRAIRISLEERGRTAVSHLRQDTWAYTGHLMRSLSDDELEELASSLNRFVEAGRAQRQADLLAEAEVTAAR